VDLVYLAIPILTLLIMLRVFLPFNRFIFNPAGFVVALYLIGLVFSISLGFIATVSVYKLSFWTMLYLSILFILYFTPLFLATSAGHQFIDISQKKIIHYLAWIFAIGSVFSFIYFLDSAIYMMSGDVGQKRNDWSWYGFRDIEFDPTLNFVATGFATFFGLIQLLAYYVKFFLRQSLQNNVLFWLLVLGSLSYVVLVLSFAGRDGIVYWIFSIVFVDLLFYRFFGFSLIFIFTFNTIFFNKFI